MNKIIEQCIEDWLDRNFPDFPERDAAKIAFRAGMKFRMSEDSSLRKGEAKGAIHKYEEDRNNALEETPCNQNKA